MMTRDEVIHVLKNVKFDNDLRSTNLQKLSESGLWADCYIRYNNLLYLTSCEQHIRIKPEPEYVPYTKDGWRDILGKIFVPNDKQYNSILISGYDEEELIYIDIDGNAYLCYDYLLKHYTHLDGTPAGKLIGE